MNNLAFHDLVISVPLLHSLKYPFFKKNQVCFSMCTLKFLLNLSVGVLGFWEYFLYVPYGGVYYTSWT